MVSRWLYILSIAFSLTVPGVGSAAVINVDCDGGDSLAAAIAAAAAGDTILVLGTCNETITIRTDGLTIDGQGGAIIDGTGGGTNTVTIDGAEALTLTGLTIQNGDEEGIFAISGAVFDLVDSLVRGNAGHGVEVIGSTGRLNGVTSQQNGQSGFAIFRNGVGQCEKCTLTQNVLGFVVFTNGVGNFSGVSDISGNFAQGLTAGLGGSVFGTGPTIFANDNGAEGCLILQDGNVELVGGVFEANGNGAEGVRIDQNSTLALGVAGFPIPGVASTNGNGGDGISVSMNSSFSSAAMTSLTSRANGGAGVRLDDSSSAKLRGATLVANAGPGDLALTFQSLATVEDNKIGKIICDKSSQVRGDQACRSRRLSRPRD